MTQLSDIQSLHWQPALGGDGVVENLDDLNQSIQIILRTAKGADPLRPEFGSDLQRYLDYPVNRARPHVVRESVEAIGRWEPRVSVSQVQFGLVDQAHGTIKVLWRLADGFAGSTEVQL